MSARPGAWPADPYPPPLVIRTNGLAIAAMVSGILFLTTVGAVLAIVFGHVALGQIKGARGLQRGNGMAVAGLVLGYGGLAVIVIALLTAGSGTFE
jgi:hypothetical protein